MQNSSQVFGSIFKCKALEMQFLFVYLVLCGLKKAGIWQFNVLFCPNRYGGPGSQRVNNRYIIDFHTHLVSSERVAYAFVDGRGTGSHIIFITSLSCGCVILRSKIPIVCNKLKFWQRFCIYVIFPWNPEQIVMVPHLNLRNHHWSVIQVFTSVSYSVTFNLLIQ